MPGRSIGPRCQAVAWRVGIDQAWVIARAPAAIGLRPVSAPGVTTDPALEIAHKLAVGPPGTGQGSLASRPVREARAEDLPASTDLECGPVEAVLANDFPAAIVPVLYLAAVARATDFPAVI